MRAHGSFLDTIVALATPAGRSAIALVRLSGSAAAQVLGRLSPGMPAPPPRRPQLVPFVDSSARPIDTGLATFFPAPGSATGEDVVEISIHGSPIAVERLLAAAMEAGARPARPGEFTERAFRSGKIDLVRAEAVRDLIEARTPAAARVSAGRLAGAVSERIGRVREDLVSAAAGLAAAIDFSEDVGEALDPRVGGHLAAAREALDRLASTAETGRLLSHGCRVAILGRPNAGKSTLFNALLGTERAIVTEIPGTTRDALEGTIDVAGIPVTLVDTAGLRQTGDPVESIGVRRAREEGERADAVLYVFDASDGPNAEDAIELERTSGRPRVVAANKADRLVAGRPALPAEAVLVCGLAPDAGERLAAALADAIAAGVSTETTSEILGSLRQRDLVLRARSAAAAAIDALDRGDSPEYAATHCDAALDALADLVGETTADDVLAKLFATFCIGK